jgi:hypothetical protein
VESPVGDPFRQTKFLPSRRLAAEFSPADPDTSLDKVQFTLCELVVVEPTATTEQTPCRESFDMDRETESPES